MAYDNRPLSFSEILDHAFRVLLDNFFLLIGIAAIYSIPSTVVPVATAWRGHLALNAIQLVLVLIVYPLSQAALIAVVAAAYVGQPVSMTEALQTVRAVLLSPDFLGSTSYPRFLFYLILATGLAAVSFLILFAPGYVAGHFYRSGADRGPAPSGCMFSRWALVKSVIVVERMGFFRLPPQSPVSDWVMVADLRTDACHHPRRRTAVSHAQICFGLCAWDRDNPYSCGTGGIRHLRHGGVRDLLLRPAVQVGGFRLAPPRRAGPRRDSNSHCVGAKLLGAGLKCPQWTGSSDPYT